MGQSFLDDKVTKIAANEIRRISPKVEAYSIIANLQE